MPDFRAQYGKSRQMLGNWDWHSYIIYIAFVVVFAYFSLTLNAQGFLTSTYLISIVHQTASISVIAVGMTFVITAAEIDLSVGAVAGLASVTTAIGISNWGLWPGVGAGLLTGAVVGAANGLLVTRVAIPSFLVTLGTMGVAHGAAQWVTSSAPQPILNQTFNNYFGGGNIGPIDTLFAWPLIMVAIGAVVLNKTSFGRQVLATGGNRVAAEFSGIDTNKIKFAVLLIGGVTAALGGMLYAGRLQTGRFQWGDGDNLSAIAAVILGGTSLFGGRGAMIGTLVGALLIGLINSGLILAGLAPSQQEIVRGLIIIAAVAMGKRK